MEESAAPLPYVIGGEQLVAGIQKACISGKWTLIAPTGATWLGKELPIIATVVLAILGSRPKQEGGKADDSTS
jgi:hypothetical protein